MKTRLLAVLFATAMLILPAHTRAQVRASEAATVSQTVDGTTVTIVYSRPVARGRSPLFGSVVRFGDLWTPGANWATTFETDRDVRVNGQAVPKGRYALWMIPQDGKDWTVVFSNRVRAFHTQKPRPTDDLLRFTVKPEETPHTEMLTWSFPAVASEAMTLRMQWGTTSVPLRITVQPTRVAHIDPEDAEPYIGTYTMSFGGEAPDGQALKVDVFMDAGRLRGRITPSGPDGDPEFDFMPAGPNRFHIGYYRDGKLFEVDAETIVMFTIVNGKATAFDYRFEGESWARAERAK